MSQTMCERAAGINPTTKREKQLAKLYKNKKIVKRHEQLVSALDRLISNHPEFYNATAESIILALTDDCLLEVNQTGEELRGRLLTVICKAFDLTTNEDCGKEVKGSWDQTKYTQQC